MYLRIFIGAALVSMSAFASIGLADDKKPFAEAMYGEMEEQIQQEWEKSFGLVKIERERKAKAGEPPLSVKREQQGTEGIKLLLYNRAVIFAICGEESARASKNADEAMSATSACTKPKLVEMVKFLKLMDYHSALDPRKYVTCEMKSRDYENEIRFAPYKFLRYADGPRLFNFKTFNKCILSDAG